MVRYKSDIGDSVEAFADADWKTFLTAEPATYNAALSRFAYAIGQNPNEVSNSLQTMRAQTEGKMSPEVDPTFPMPMVLSHLPQAYVFSSFVTTSRKCWARLWSSLVGAAITTRIGCSSAASWRRCSECPLPLMARMILSCASIRDNALSSIASLSTLHAPFYAASWRYN